MRRELAVSLWLVAGLAAWGRADDPERLVVHDPEVGEAVGPTVIDVDLRNVPSAPGWLPGDPVRDVEGEKERDRPREDETAPGTIAPVGREDPLLRRRPPTSFGLDPTFGTPTLAFAGLGFSGAVPADAVGDVGPNHYVQATNNGSQGTGAQFAVFKKTGEMLAGPLRLSSLATGGGCVNGFTDPVVVYDRLADRWVLMEVSRSNTLCVYVSRGPDPVTSGFFRYEFATPGFPDYPKLSVWPDAYYLSTNEDVTAYALERTSMLAGEASPRWQRFTVPPLAGFSFQALLPADLDGPAAPPPGAPGIFMRHRDDEVHNPPGTPQDFLELWEFRVDWDMPGHSTLTGPFMTPVSEFDSALCPATPLSCIVQPGGASPLDAVREPLMWRLQYRNFGGYESLVGSFTTDVTGTDVAGVRWFEQRKTTNPPSLWRLWQEGTLGDATTNRWIGSAAQDGWGNIALAYSVSSPTVVPGLRYAGRLATAWPGTLPEGEYTLKDGSVSSPINRWGDYASMSVDPVDECTFWFTGPFGEAPFWATWIGAFRFEYCGVPDFYVAATPAYVAEPPRTTRTLSVGVHGLNGFASPVTLSAPGLPAGMTATFGSNPLTPAGTHGAPVTDMTLVIPKTAPPGLYTVTVRGTSGGLVHDSLVSVRVTTPALWDATLRVPACYGFARSCDSVAQLVGRGTVGPEAGAPNTIGGACADSSAGTFHVSESLDRLLVYSTDASNLHTGGTARIEATVWVATLDDRLDLFRAADAAAPVWTYLTTLTPTATGRQVLTAPYTLPAGSRQAIRGRFRPSGAPASCATGTYVDHDDLVFPVALFP